MKQITSWLLCLILVFMPLFVQAEPARYFKQDKNRTFHAEHLRLHIGSKNCKASGNYLKIRTEPDGKKVVGHLEMADTFTLDEISDHWARITVVRAAKTSPDSHNGLSGWVDADYIECPCSSDEYYDNKPSLTYSLAITLQKTTNLREEPSKGSTSFGKLSKDDQVEVISEYIGKDNKTWYRVRSSSGTMGYIRSDLLEITKTDIPEEIAGSDPTSSVIIAETTSEPDLYDQILSEYDSTATSTDEYLLDETSKNNQPDTETQETETAVTMLITPDLSLPSSAEVTGNTAGRTTGNGDGVLNSFTLAKEDMWNAIVNKPHYLCFTVEPDSESASPIQLVQWDTETTIGIMVDNGTNGDEVADDGVYSLGIYVTGINYGKAQYLAIQDDFWSNDVIVHFYEPDWEKYGHYVLELQSSQEEIVSSGGNVFSKLIEHVKEQFLLGNVSEYYIDDNTIRYCESRTNYTLVYESPNTESIDTTLTENDELYEQGDEEDEELEEWQRSYREVLYGDEEESP